MLSHVRNRFYSTLVLFLSIAFGLNELSSPEGPGPNLQKKNLHHLCGKGFQINKKDPYQQVKVLLTTTFAANKAESGEHSGMTTLL